MKKEKDNFADAQTLDVPISTGRATNQVNFENQGEWKFQDIGEIKTLSSNLYAHELSNLDEFTDVASSHSWREVDINNLLRSPVDRVSPGGPKEEASTHGTEKTNLTMSLTKSTTYWCPGNFIEMNQETEEVSEWEDHITTDKSSICPTTSKQEEDICSYEGKEGYQLQFLFATPIKSGPSCKVSETLVCEKHTERADFSFMECFGPTKENEVTKTNSGEKVEVSGKELENYLGLRYLMLTNGKDIRNPEIEKMRESVSLTKENVFNIKNEEVNEDVGSKVSKTYSRSILSEAKYDGNEVQTESTSECMKESNTVSEKNEDTGVERVNVVEMKNNICRTVLSEATLDCRKKHWIDNTGERMKKSNSVTEEIEEDIMNEEVIEVESFEVENIFSNSVFTEAKFDAYKEQCTDNDSKSSEENNIIPSLKNILAGKGSAEMLLDFDLSENHSNGDMDYVKNEREITRSSGDVPGIIDNDTKQGNVVEEDSHCFIECHKDNSWETSVDTFEKNLNPEVTNKGSYNGEETNLAIHKDSPPCILSKASDEKDKVIENEVMEMASSKSHFDGYTLDNDMISTSGGIQKICEERASPHHSVHTLITTAEHAPTFLDQEPDMLQSFATHLFVEESECVNTEKPNMEASNFNMKGNQEVDGGGVPLQFFMSEFYPEDLKTDTRAVSDSSAYDCSNAISEESNLVNTINECLESEYSVAVLDDSDANLYSDLDEPQRGTDERVDYFDDNADKPSIGKESEEQEESALFLEPDKGSMNETLAGQKELNIKDDSCSAAKKNARTILIHGTPGKLFLTDNMKENAPDTKRSQIGGFTTVRPTKRRALQDVRWK